MIENGEALNIGGESALKGLVDDAKELKKAVVDFSNIREWGGLGSQREGLRRHEAPRAWLERHDGGGEGRHGCEITHRPGAFGHQG